ncbi:MAG: hypothetical protein ACI87O_000988 [Planctomycetota bacterium]
MRDVYRVLGIVFLILCSGCSGETETEEIEVGFRGLAARNPYLGAQRLAEELGYEGRGTGLLSALPPTDWVLLLRPGVMTGGEDQAKDLLQWVKEGGDLWVDLEDFILEEDRATTASGPAQWALYKLLREIDLKVVGNEGEPHVEGLPSTPHLRVPWPETDVVLSDPYNRAWEHWGRSGHAAMVDLPWGAGGVHFFATLSGFDNEHLRDDNWAELFEHLLLRSGPDRATQGILVVYGGGRSFLALLWQHGWYFLIAMGLLTIVWVWRVSRRFGPVLEDPSWDPEGVGIGGGREFVEHIVAAGRTYERRGQLDRLVNAAGEHARTCTLHMDPETAQPSVSVSNPAQFLRNIKTLQASAERGSAEQLSTIAKPEQDND